MYCVGLKMHVPDDVLCLVISMLEGESVWGLSLCSRGVRATLLGSVRCLRDPLGALVALLSGQRLWSRRQIQRRFALTRRQMEGLALHRVRHNGWAHDKFEVMRLVVSVHGSVRESLARAAEHAVRLGQQRACRERQKRARSEAVTELVGPSRLHQLQRHKVFRAFVQGRLAFWSASDLVAHMSGAELL